jgi:hypothetical protein
LRVTVASGLRPDKRICEGFKTEEGATNEEGENKEERVNGNVRQGFGRWQNAVLNGQSGRVGASGAITLLVVSRKASPSGNDELRWQFRTMNEPPSLDPKAGFEFPLK